VRRLAFFGALLALVPGCALAHEVTVDANVDAGGAAEVLRPCTGGGSAGPSRDCGWTVGGTLSCRPGAAVRVGCGADCGLGSCSGDAVIRVCDSVSCTSARSLGENDDACGSLCPVTNVVCPPSGRLFVLTGPFSAGNAYTCSFVSR
jgi:hypothetical protein